mmetsp:Transcript_4252/g.6672  ORF Transcript_4252/g.6672 Transcript_4252/m.6672 type:complete len:279 (+) Transcript_4252:9747-10583(+)
MGSRLQDLGGSPKEPAAAARNDEPLAAAVPAVHLRPQVRKERQQKVLRNVPLRRVPEAAERPAAPGPALRVPRPKAEFRRRERGGLLAPARFRIHRQRQVRRRHWRHAADRVQELREVHPELAVHGKQRHGEPGLDPFAGAGQTLRGQGEAPARVAVFSVPEPPGSVPVFSGPVPDDGIQPVEGGRRLCQKFPERREAGHVLWREHRVVEKHHLRPPERCETSRGASARRPHSDRGLVEQDAEKVPVLPRLVPGRQRSGGHQLPAEQPARHPETAVPL